jgi:hypothetical protein
MTIDWENERVIPLRDVPKYVPSRVRGRKLSVATAWRWALQRRDPLETFRTPGGRFTSVEALGRFLERCSRPEAPGTQRTSTPASTDAHNRALDAGEKLWRLIG